MAVPVLNSLNADVEGTSTHTLNAMLMILFTVSMETYRPNHVRLAENYNYTDWGWQREGRGRG